MKTNKLILGVLIIGVVCIIVLGYMFFSNNNRNTNNDTTISDDYIAVFYGGAGERVCSTYVYKIDNGKPNYGFKYINTVSTTTSWGSTEWNEEIINSGKVDWTDDVFAVAKKNGAYDYVRVPNNTQTYTIEQFMDMFMMN